MRDARLVEVPDDERRARDRLGHAERPRRPAHERRLAGAELARHQHDVTGRERRGERRAGALGLLRRGGLATTARRTCARSATPAARKISPSDPGTAASQPVRGSCAACAGAAAAARRGGRRCGRAAGAGVAGACACAGAGVGVASWDCCLVVAERVGVLLVARRSAPNALAGSSASSMPATARVSTPTPHALRG